MLSCVARPPRRGTEKLAGRRRLSKRIFNFADTSAGFRQEEKSIADYADFTDIKAIVLIFLLHIRIISVIRGFNETFSAF